MQVSICQTFPALDPLRLRREKSGEVLLLLRRMIRYNNNRPTDNQTDSETVQDDGTIIIRHKNGDVEYLHPAKDDSRW